MTNGSGSSGRILPDFPASSKILFIIVGMSRLINSESAGKERTRLTKTVVISIRELLKQKEPGDLSRDLIACVLTSLDGIYETVDASVEAWEKRGYWLKADRFRMEWQWTQIIADKMRPLVMEENYGELIPLMVEVLQALDSVKVSENHRLGTPWTGAWDELQRSVNKRS